MNSYRLIAISMIATWCFAAHAEGPLTTAGSAVRDDHLRSDSPVAARLGTANWGDTLRGPLCGIYAACTAVDLIGMDANPRDFVKAQYLGGCGGSSPEEVARVVKSAGAQASILSRMSTFDIRLLGCPVIANVRMSMSSDRFNHWVVVVPSATGMTIFDGLRTPYDVRTAEFLGIWSGIGICVTRPGPTPLLSVWMGRFAILLTILLVVVLSRGTWSAIGRVLRSNVNKQVCGMCVASLAFAVPGNFVFGDLPHHWKGVVAATAPTEQEKRYRVGTLDDARKASASSDMLLVDARLETDYRQGTIKGAVNVPVTVPVWAVEKYLGKLDRYTPIVVFCQSARCDFDETVAAGLTTLGFSNVTVCDEGWWEFQKSADLVGRR